jgi:hypothetical protein
MPVNDDKKTLGGQNPGEFLHQMSGIPSLSGCGGMMPSCILDAIYATGFPLIGFPDAGLPILGFLSAFSIYVYKGSFVI